jgi:hypothetical protein
MSDHNGHVDLDLDKPRTFRLRGEVFRINHVNLTEYAHAVEALDRAEAAGESFEAIWNAQADFLEVSIHPDDIDKFREIRHRKIDSLEPADVRALYTYLWGVHTGRPTSSAEASTPGPENNEASSKAGSGSPVVARPN